MFITYILLHIQDSRPYGLEGRAFHFVNLYTTLVNLANLFFTR